MSFFSNLMARICLGIISFSYDENDVANAAAKVLIQENWITMREEYYYTTITTTTNKIISFWNSNKYYSWMARGYIQIKDKQLTWEDGMPCAALMYQVYRKMNKFRKRQINEFLLT